MNGQVVPPQPEVLPRVPSVMVGAAGFEPAFSSFPKRAGTTGLPHTPLDGLGFGSPVLIPLLMSDLLKSVGPSPRSSYLTVALVCPVRERREGGLTGCGGAIETLISYFYSTTHHSIDLVGCQALFSRR